MRIIGLFMWIPYWRGRSYITLGGILLGFLGALACFRALASDRTWQQGAPVVVALGFFIILAMTVVGAQRRW